MDWAMIGLMVACAGALALTGLRVSDRRLHVMLLRADVPAEPNVVTLFRARLRARGIAGVVGSLAAALICTVLLLAAPALAGPHPDGPDAAASTMYPQLQAAIFLTCLIVATALPALAPLVRPRTRAPRYARLALPLLGDYVAPWRLWSARGLAVAALASIPLIASGSLDVVASVTGLVCAVGAVVVLVAVESLSRRMLATPQPAGSPLDLIADDALRSWSLCALWAAPFALAAAALSVAAASAGIGTLATLGSSAISLAPALLIAGSLNSRYRRRLWPDGPVDPGDPGGPGRAAGPGGPVGPGSPSDPGNGPTLPASHPDPGWQP